MAIYLGDSGFVELKRDALDDALVTLLDPHDVNPERRRFSVDFAAGSLVSGDQLEISTLDGSLLELVAGHPYPDGRWYAHVDQAGGIRLFNTFEAAISNRTGEALPLVTPSVARQVQIHTRNSRYRSIGRIKSFDLTTSRDTVDITELGQEFRQQYEAGLISGQGTLSAFWEHSYALCDPDYAINAPEFPVYLARLVLRLQQGADFLGRFFVHRGDATTRSVWYEADCVVTNVAVSVAATQTIDCQINFVTNGPVQLQMGHPPSYLLQESGGDLILQEDGSGILVEEPL